MSSKNTVFEQQLEKYQPLEKYQLELKQKFLDFFNQYSEMSFKRENLSGHFTGSAFVVNLKSKKFALVEHKKLHRWLQPGGHADGDSDIQRVAAKELKEETGLKNFEVALEGNIFDLDLHEIPEHKNTPRHFHYDLRFLFTTEEDELVCSEESKDLRWFDQKEFSQLKSDESVKRLVAKASDFFE